MMLTAAKLICLLAVAVAPQTPRLQPLGTRAALSGDVTSPVTRQPVPNMEVHIRLSGELEWKTVTTDEAGRYSFPDLVPGRYFVRLSGPDYEEAFEDVMLRGGRETRLSLSKRAILEGRVIDELGRPVPGIEVCALLRTGGDRMELVPREYAMTNGDGVFRISRHPLRAWPSLGGKYVLAVIPSGCLLAESGPPRKIQPLPGVVPTFLPNVTSFRDATVVEVAGDERVSGLEIRLRRGPSTRVEGRIAPLPQTLLPPVARIILEPPADQVPIVRVLNVNPDGRFVFDGVLPGEYRLIVPPTQRINARSVWAEQALRVSGAATQTVFVPTKPSLEVSGQMLFDGYPMLLPGVRVFLIVNLEPDFGDSRVDARMLPSPFGFVEGSGRFTIPGVMPGRYRFSVSGADTRGWILDGATIPAPPGTTPPDRDVFNLPFVVADDLDIPGASLAMTRAASTLRVLLRDANDRPIPGFDVVLFAADPKYWFPTSRRILRQRAGGDGAVTFEDLPKGDYVAVATKSLTSDWNSASGLESLAKVGTRVQIEPSETKTVTILPGESLVK